LNFTSVSYHVKLELAGIKVKILVSNDDGVYADETLGVSP
jgi:hypothetical protein